MAQHDENALDRAVSSMFCNPELDLLGDMLALPQQDGDQLLLDLLLEALEP